jgi:cobalt/nickel transport protein
MLGRSVLLLAALGFAASAWAHFGVILPDQSTVMDQEKTTVHFDISFQHPMEQQGLTMAPPKAFGVFAGGKKTDLKAGLKKQQILGKDAFSLDYKLARPGIYQFYVEPEPYWEPAEDKFIIHYTKVILPAFVDDEGWDAPVGLATEIVPLTRPYGNYAGNSFQGQVLLNGKPAPDTEVEVEYYNKDKKLTAPNDLYVTQVVKTDANGVFTYTVPWAGWWGFAALSDAPYKLKQDGRDKDVEIGAVIWAEFAEPLKK